jgi:hypothetical protein
MTTSRAVSWPPWPIVEVDIRQGVGRQTVNNSWYMDGWPTDARVSVGQRRPTGARSRIGDRRSAAQDGNLTPCQPGAAGNQVGRERSRGGVRAATVWLRFREQTDPPFPCGEQSGWLSHDGILGWGHDAIPAPRDGPVTVSQMSK